MFLTHLNNLDIYKYIPWSEFCVLLLLLLKKFLKMSFLFHKVRFFSVSLRPTKSLPSVILDSLQCARSKAALGKSLTDNTGAVTWIVWLEKANFFSVLITSTESWRHLTLSNLDTSSSLLDTKLLLAGHEKMKISQHTITVFSSHLIVKNCTEEVWLNSRTFSFAACYCPRMDNYHF